jgi:tetratricopeptide (TPR) repeat protein
VDSQPYKYWAFLSYSHADEAWARWLHRRLERYAVPRRLVGTATATGPIPARLFPIFRDREELAGSAHLAPELQQALKLSRYQIVICSPAAARSRWVGEEIRYFKSLGRGDRVLALIVEGEPHAADPALECFPEALRFEYDAAGQPGNPAEPIAADARKSADGKTNAALKLIAGILGVGFDELKRRDLQARNQRLAFVSALACGVAALTLVLAVQAYRARNDALRRQAQAEDLIRFMLGDLREKLEPIGKLAILDAVGDKAMDYFATLEDSDRTDAALASRAKALRQVGEVRLKQGDLAGASAAFEEAVSLDRALLERHPDDIARLQSIADSEFAMGNAHYIKGEFDKAQTWVQRNAISAARLAHMEPKNPKWLGMVADANSNLGAIAFKRGEPDAAREFFRKARDAQKILVDAHPGNAEFVLLLAQFHGWLSAVESGQRQWQPAFDEAVLESDLLRSLVRREPENATYRERLGAALIKQITNRARLGPLPPTDPVLTEVLDLSRELAEFDPENIDYARMHRIGLSMLEEAFIVARKIPEATQANADALALARALQARSSGRAELGDDLMKELLRSIKLAALRKDGARVAALLAEAHALPLSEPQRSSIPAARWLDLALLAWSAAKPGTRHQAAASAAEWMAEAKGSGSVSPELMLRYEALSGRGPEAQTWHAQLSDAERAHPFVEAFCAQTKRCAAQKDKPRLRHASSGK